jgi:Pvc16 N-terminal domain/IPT/TIG domain
VSYLAIGAVTKALAELLTRKLNHPQLMGTTNFRVTTLPPDDDRVTDDIGINLFLYRVSENPFASNMDWRGDRVAPVNGNRPPLALTLSYMMTAYAKKTGGTAQDDIATQQLLGNAMAILHENPVLNDIHDSEFDADLDTQFAAELRNAFQKIRVSLLPISMEEFSKIWTGFSKAYRLSVAYDVSLVEIGPLAAAPLPPGAVQQAAVQLGPLRVPSIASVQPASGPAGAQVSIRGANLQLPGVATTVTVGDLELEESELLLLSPQEIRLTIPEAPTHGPALAIVVAAGAAASAPATYRVAPWIDGIVPLRGITGIGLTIPFQPAVGATVAVEIDGQSAPATVDARGTAVQTVVPQAIASAGPKTVVLLVNGARSNARLFEVLPLIQSVAFVTQASPAKTTITITGERLNGQDVGVLAGGVHIKVGANSDAGKITASIDRVLAANPAVTVTIDGRQSNVLPPRLDSIDPPRALPGDEVVLSGAGLSGRAVSVSFGATTVSLGAQPFASRVRTAVPGAMAAGVVQAKLTVDGHDTNSISFEVTS